MLPSCSSHAPCAVAAQTGAVLRSFERRVDLEEALETEGAFKGAHWLGQFVGTSRGSDAASSKAGRCPHQPWAVTQAIHWCT